MTICVTCQRDVVPVVHMDDESLPDEHGWYCPLCHQYRTEDEVDLSIDQATVDKLLRDAYIWANGFLLVPGYFA